MNDNQRTYYPGEDSWVADGNDVKLVGSHCPKCDRNYFPPASFVLPALNLMHLKWPWKDSC